MVPYTYYRLCESERGADGKSRQRTVLGLGELTDFPTDAERHEWAELLTELIRDGRCRMSYTPGLYDAALGFYGKWMDGKREAEKRGDELAEKTRRDGASYCVSWARNSGSPLSPSRPTAGTSGCKEALHRKRS